MSAETAGVTDARLEEHVGPARRAGRGLVAILAAATLTAWVQLAEVTVRRGVFGVFSWKWWLRDQIFLTAAGYLLVLPALALVPLLVHVLWPRRYPFAALAATLAGLGAFCALLVFERISWVAWLVVAVGLGVQLHRLMSSRPRAAWRWTWRVALLGNLATALAVVTVGQLRRSSEAAAVHALPPARRGAPSVLFIIMDTERAKSMSLYGAPEQTTPHLAAWGRQGVVFDAAYATSSWTLPSHASMFTGRYPSHTSADWLSPLNATGPTLAEAFRAQGYVTGGFVANINLTGYRTGLARGFVHFEDSKRSLRQVLLGTTVMQAGSVARAMDAWTQTHWMRHTLRTALNPIMLRPRDGAPEEALSRAADVADDFLAWLPAADERPYFAFLNFFDAHGPYQPPPPYRTMFDPDAGARGRYHGAMRYVDDTIDALLRRLDRRGLLRETIVVIASDHGEMFGENGLIGHGNGLYRPQLHVPLVVLNAPGAVPGTRVRQKVSLRDLPATLLDLAAIPNTAGLEGTSLRPLLSGASSLPSASPIFSELSPSFNVQALKVVKSPLKSLIDDSSHVLVNATGEVTVFAYPADTSETQDLAASASVRDAARARLNRVMGALGIVWTR